MNEFEDIKGFENLYRINRAGEVWSCRYNKQMTIQTNEYGYLFISLSIKQKKQKLFIHRLLALQYIENPDDLPQIDHIDRDKLNNSLENLRWVSQQTNRLNRSDILENKSEEELKAHTEKWKQYKSDWAKKKRETLTEEEKEIQRNRVKEFRRNKSLSLF